MNCTTIENDTVQPGRILKILEPLTPFPTFVLLFSTFNFFSYHEDRGKEPLRNVENDPPNNDAASQKTVLFLFTAVTKV